jgi:hypothetical protein
MKSIPENSDSDPSDSIVQREIEIKMLHRLGDSHPDWQPISWKKLAADLGLVPVWQKAEPDAAWKTDSGQIILAECYSRIGELKPGHRRKLAMDVLKKRVIRDILAKENHIKCLLVVPKELKDKLVGDGWFSATLSLTADIVTVELLEDEKRKLATASTRQAQGQARTKRAGKECSE